MQRLLSVLCKFSILVNVILGGFLMAMYMENTYLRIIIGGYGQEVPALVNSSTVIKLAREKASICATEVSLVADYGKMSVSDIIKVANDIEKVRGGDLTIAQR